MFKLEQIKDASINLTNLFGLFELKKWKHINLDTSYNYIDSSTFIEEYRSNNNFNTGILISDVSDIDFPHYIEDVSGNYILKTNHLPDYFIWQVLNELNTDNVNLKNKVFQLENLVSQLIAVVDPSIN
jgi:hypothetical protein